jgi:transposase
MKANYRGIEFEINNKEDFDLLFSSVGQPVRDIPSSPSKDIPQRNKRHMAWSDSDDKFLLDNVEKLGIRVLARMLGRTMGAVKARLHLLKTKSVGIHAHTKPKNVEKPIPVSRRGRSTGVKKAIISLLSQGKSYKDIVRTTSFSLKQVYDIAYKARKDGILNLPKLPSGPRRHSNNEDIIKLLATGKSYSDVAKETGLKLSSVYNIAYKARRDGILKMAHTLPKRIVEKIGVEDISTAVFSMIPKDKLDVARNMISACSKTKSKITTADCVTFFGLSVGESRAFMIDVFQQQSKYGYKVLLEKDKLVFQ